jgi:hypothetical protein
MIGSGAAGGFSFAGSAWERTCSKLRLALGSGESKPRAN